MPGIFYQPLDRRTFLKTSLLAGGALAFNGCQSTATHPRSENPNRLHLALLSDTHVPGDRKNGHRGFNPWENLRRIVPAVMQSRPDGVIVNGDAARMDGQPDDYKELKELLSPIANVAPVYTGLGNHDNRTHFFETFKPPASLAQDVRGRHVSVIEHESVRVIVLDSLLYVNQVAGLLGETQRNWLKDFLPGKTDRPVVFFVHHTLGQGDGDLLDSPALFEIIRPHRQVKAIFYGHSHAWKIGERQDVRLINLPAVGYNFSDTEPVGWVDATFHPRGVDLTLRAFAGNQVEDGKTTSVRWI